MTVCTHDDCTETATVSIGTRVGTLGGRKGAGPLITTITWDATDAPKAHDRLCPSHATALITALANTLS